ncbi:unnamed protein product [Hermetia illucens]|uniref:Uncharacterized protein n=1 Tax=Hermetia illucens TaxID=343691 RepID=A0A7R8UCC4_HERIL|nr:unnamed protein product [Hermetia illucens]
MLVNSDPMLDNIPWRNVSYPISKVAPARKCANEDKRLPSDNVAKYESVRLSKQQQQDGVCQFASTGSYPQEWQSEPYKSRLDKSPIWDNGDRRIRQICGGTRVFRPEPNNAMYSLFKQYLLNEYNYTNQNSEFDSVCYIPPEETDTVETSSSRPPATRPTSQVPPVQPPTDICYCDEETAIERLWRIITFRY